MIFRGGFFVQLNVAYCNLPILKHVFLPLKTDTLSKENLHKKKNTTLHPRSKHKGQYNFDILIEKVPELKEFVFKTNYGNFSIDFFNPTAVKALNKAILLHHYNLDYWDIPEHYLCPPIPGRADYIHAIADLLEDTSVNTNIIGLDIGTGANCIYPLIGHQSYGWQFIATDIDKTALNSAKNIIKQNRSILKDAVEIRHQEHKANKLKDILQAKETIDFVMCNPPFHASENDAKKAATRKLKNLKGKLPQKITLNFSGTHNELWCKGGEPRFIKDLLFESRHFASQCQWFTTLVSKASNLKAIYADLKTVKAKRVKTIEMGQGNKISRIVAWSFS